jgi:CheY-like chemotaxis protein
VTRPPPWNDASRNQFEIPVEIKTRARYLRHFANPDGVYTLSKMGLSCLLLTSDPALLEMMRHSCIAAAVDLELRIDAASAIELSARRHLDGFMIDRDDVSGAMDVLPRIRSSGSNHRSVVFVVVNDTTSIDTAFKAGANFVLAKPVQDTVLRGFLDIAVGRMEREHRRYFRHKVSVPILLFCNTGESFAGKIMNVSEGGLALAPFGPAAVQGAVTVQFELPSAESQTFKAKAEVVWNDAHAVGLRFLRVAPECRSNFAAWLDSLEAQLQFHQSTQPGNPA